MNISQEQLDKILEEIVKDKLEKIERRVDKILEILESSTKKPNQTKKTAKVSYTQKHADIANEMYQTINATVKTRQPNLVVWANEIRKLNEIDKIPVDKILGVFKAANKDDFWSMNIRSPQKLRKHWDRLYIISLTQTSGLNHKIDKRESLDYYKDKKW